MATNAACSQIAEKGGIAGEALNGRQNKVAFVGRATSNRAAKPLKMFALKRLR
jgi:hypothetical protein